MSLTERIRRNRASLSIALGNGRYRDFSPAHASRCRETERLISAYARGRVLDVGCGHMPFRNVVLEHADSYEGLDVEPRTKGVAYVCDVADMDGVPRAAFDSVLCLEVLEHVPHPDRALAAIVAVLRPGGVLIISVPHLSRLHEEPHDYFRFTGHGLRKLLDRSGLELMELAPHAGLMSFLGHQLSTVICGAFWSVPGLRSAAYHANRFLVVYPALWIDRVMGLGRLYPLGFVAVARKRAPNVSVS